MSQTADKTTIIKADNRQTITEDGAEMSGLLLEGASEGNEAAGEEAVTGLTDTGDEVCTGAAVTVRGLVVTAVRGLVVTAVRGLVVTGDEVEGVEVTG